MINIKNLSVSLGRKAIVNHADFSIEAGSTAVFIGANGAGKTTTLRAITGLIPSTGSSSLSGENRRLHVGISLGPDYLPQDISIRNFLRLTACPLSEFEGQKDRAIHLLKELSLHKRMDTKIHKLSMGMRQKLSLIAALRFSPLALVLDEPYNGLDPDSIEWLENELIQTRNRGAATILSSHLLREAAAVADSAFKIENGNVSRVSWPPKTSDGPWMSVWVVSTNPVVLSQILSSQGYKVNISDDRIETNAKPDAILSAAYKNELLITDIGPIDSSGR